VVGPLSRLVDGDGVDAWEGVDGGGEVDGGSGVDGGDWVGEVLLILLQSIFKQIYIGIFHAYLMMYLYSNKFILHSCII